MTNNPWVEEETFYRAYLTEDVDMSIGVGNSSKNFKKGSIVGESRDLHAILQRSVMRPVRIVKVRTWTKLEVQEEDIWSSEGKWPELGIEESEDV